MTLIVMLATFFVLLFLGAPIVLAMGAAGMSWLLSVGNIPLLSFAQKIYTATDSFGLLAIPFFMLAGQVMERAGITEKLVDFADACIGWVTGGLACVCELAGMLMAGISGSANADASALGSMMIPALKKGGYHSGWAAAIAASAASIGPIIPPSCTMLVYANAAGLNIGRLFMGGIIPGIMLGLGYMVVCVIYAKKEGIPKTEFKGFKNLVRAFFNAFWALLMPIIIIGGIMLGIFTATESGCIAAIYGICYGFVTKTLTLKQLKESFKGAMVGAVGPLALIAFSSIVSFAMAREGITTAIAQFCSTYLNSQVAVLLFVILICFLAGMFIDGTATMLILTPIMLPIVEAMGIDVQVFSMIFMLGVVSGGITPPVGGHLFIACAAGGVDFKDCIKPAVPFACVMLLVMIIMCFVPGISTFIPNLVFG